VGRDKGGVVAVLVLEWREIWAVLLAREGYGSEEAGREAWTGGSLSGATTTITRERSALRFY